MSIIRRKWTVNGRIHLEIERDIVLNFIKRELNHAGVPCNEIIGLSYGGPQGMSGAPIYEMPSVDVVVE